MPVGPIGPRRVEVLRRKVLKDVLQPLQRHMIERGAAERHLEQVAARKPNLIVVKVKRSKRRSHRQAPSVRAPESAD